MRAQVGSATLGGTVQDQLGAAVAGATVTLQNEATGLVRASSSNEAGAFTFSAVPSGDYKLVIQEKGFKQLIRPDIHLNPGDNILLADLHLGVGAASESVTVNAEVAALPLDSGQLSATITGDDLDGFRWSDATRPSWKRCCLGLQSAT